MMSWCRRFIKDFGVIAKPLYDLVTEKTSRKLSPEEKKELKERTERMSPAELKVQRSKNTGWIKGVDPKIEFTDEQRRVFETLKEKMSTLGVMKLFEPEKEIVIRTDACKEGFGAVMFQRDDDGKLRIVEYASKQISKAIGNLHSMELECAAIMWALDKWKPYLNFRPFILQTDNSAVVWLMKKKDLSGRMARWVMTLQSLDFKIEHRADSPNPPPSGSWPNSWG